MEWSVVCIKKTLCGGRGVAASKGMIFWGPRAPSWVAKQPSLLLSRTCGNQLRLRILDKGGGPLDHSSTKGVGSWW